MFEYIPFPPPNQRIGWRKVVLKVPYSPRNPVAEARGLPYDRWLVVRAFQYRVLRETQLSDPAIRFWLAPGTDSAPDEALAVEHPVDGRPPLVIALPQLPPGQEATVYVWYDLMRLKDFTQQDWAGFAIASMVVGRDEQLYVPSRAGYVYVQVGGNVGGIASVGDMATGGVVAPIVSVGGSE